MQGTYARANTTTCLQCAAGSFAGAEGATSCTQCPVAWYALWAHLRRVCGQANALAMARKSGVGATACVRTCPLDTTYFDGQRCRLVYGSRCCPFCA